MQRTPTGTAASALDRIGPLRTSRGAQTSNDVGRCVESTSLKYSCSRLSWDAPFDAGWNSQALVEKQGVCFTAFPHSESLFGTQGIRHKNSPGQPKCFLLSQQYRRGHSIDNRAILDSQDYNPKCICGRGNSTVLRGTEKTFATLTGRVGSVPRAATHSLGW